MRSRPDVRKCGTCQYWAGKRELAMTEKQEERVDIADDIGECENGISIFCGTTRKQSLKCKNYSRWTEMM